MYSLVKKPWLILPPHCGRCCLVQLVAALSDGQGLLEGLLDLVQGGAGGLDLPLCLGDGPGQPLHLGLEQVQGHGVGV